MRSSRHHFAYAVCVLCILFATGCEAPPIKPGINQPQSLFPNRAEAATVESPIDVTVECTPVDASIDEYAVAGNCVASVRFRPEALHGEYKISLRGNDPIRFQPTGNAVGSADGLEISWNMTALSGAESLRRIGLTFLPENAPDGLTMNGIYGILACATHLERGTVQCTHAKIDRPDRTWQEINAEWSTGQTTLGYYFAPINSVESWLFIKLSSTDNEYEPEMSITLQDGLRINVDPAKKPYYLQVRDGGRSADILPRHLGKLFKDDARIIVLHVLHDGATEGKMPVRVTVRSDNNSFWEDSTVLLATSINADGSLHIAAQTNPVAQKGVPGPPINATVTPDPTRETAQSFIEIETPTPTSQTASPESELPESITPTVESEYAAIVMPASSTQRGGCSTTPHCKQPTNIAWTVQFIAPRTMHRYDAYTTYLTDLRPYLTFEQFSYLFLVHNPQVNRKMPILREGKTYNFPTLIDSSQP